MVWVSVYMLAPDRGDNLEHRELNLLARREVVTCPFSELPFPMEFYDDSLCITGRRGGVKFQRSGYVSLPEKGR